VVLITYKGMLANGTTFDEATEPTPMPVAEVVPGFSEGLKLMPRGATYRFWIKPELGYGNEATGPIPAHAILVFDLHLLDFKSLEEIRQMQQQMQAQQPGATPTAPPPPKP
jgi:FKBP-type peptidyl-prolyl cis-trans isomerase FkpA